MRGHEGLRGDAQRIGAGDGVWLVMQNEIENRGEHRAFANAGAQFFGGDAGEGEQAIGVIFIGQDPAQRPEGQGFWIICVILRIAKNCQFPSEALEQ
jgi:hypothetical protein